MENLIITTIGLMEQGRHLQLHMMMMDMEVTSNQQQLEDSQNQELLELHQRQSGLHAKHLDSPLVEF